MKKPVVDYREFRFNKLNTPQFQHLKLLFGWVGYLFMYLITENFISRDKCTVIHSSLDDIIPFCEIFVIPYVLWFGLILGSLVYFAFYSIEGFKRLQIFMMVTQVIAMTVYIVFPNRQDLRPDEFTRNNFLTEIVGFLYRIDTDTNVCPSLHVAYSIGIVSVYFKEKYMKPSVKIGVAVFAFIICLSTFFIKQHSVWDALAAIPLCIVAEIISCGGFWKEKLRLKN